MKQVSLINFVSELHLMLAHKRQKHCLNYLFLNSWKQKSALTYEAILRLLNHRIKYLSRGYVFSYSLYTTHPINQEELVLVIFGSALTDLFISGCL